VILVPQIIGKLFKLLKVKAFIFSECAKIKEPLLTKGSFLFILK